MNVQGPLSTTTATAVTSLQGSLQSPAATAGGAGAGAGARIAAPPGPGAADETTFAARLHDAPAAGSPAAAGRPAAGRPAAGRSVEASPPGSAIQRVPGQEPSAATPLRPAARSTEPQSAEPPAAVTQELTEALTRIRTEERKLDRFLRRARHGADFELSELVQMQSLVYRYTRQVELLSKLVERVTGAVKQTLRTQV